MAILLSAREVEACARVGDCKATEVTLDKGRRLLEAHADVSYVVDICELDFVFYTTRR